MKCLHFYYWMFLILCKISFAKVSKCSHINIKKKEWSDTWEILHDGHIGPSRLPNQPPAGGVCEAPHHNLPARKNTQVTELINRSTNSKIIPKIKKHNNFSVHDCFYLEASEVHFYWLHNDPVPNGRLHMHLRSCGWTMVMALAWPLSPICHFSFQEGAPLLRPLYALLLSPHWGELHGRLRPTVKSALRHKSVDSEEDCEGF